MRKLVLIGYLYFTQLLCAQNLVPNPSFEDYDSCPMYTGQFFVVQDWYSPTSNSPDYFNSCWNESWNDNPDVPINRFGSETAHSGMAYAGIAGPYTTLNTRDYVSIILLDSLKAGSKYCLEFYISLGDSSWGGVNFIGAHLSTAPDTMYAGFYLNNLPFQPQIEYDSVISDTSGWTKISGLYTAIGGECYLTIGVFKPDSLLTYDSIQGNGSVQFSYYYIDDVAVWNCDTSATVYPEIIFFPNPSNGQFNITGNFPLGTELFVYNMLGQIVCDPISLPEGNNNVPVFIDVAVGLYYYKVFANDTILSEGKMVIIR